MISVSDVLDHYSVVAADFTARLRACSDEQLGAPSPCVGWTARDVVGHVIDGHRELVASLTEATREPLPADADLLAEWRDATEAVSVLLVVPELSATRVGGAFGNRRFDEVVANVVCTDTLIHTWDLARATAQDDRLNPAAVAAAQRFLTEVGERMRGPSGLGPPLPVAAGADAQAVLLAFSGRQV